MKDKTRILKAYSRRLLNNEPRSKNEMLSEIQRIKGDKSKFRYLISYNGQKIISHMGLDNLGNFEPLFIDIRKACTNLFLNTYAYELDKASLILTANRNYLHQCKFVTQKLVKAPYSNLQFLIRRTSELIQFEGSTEIYIYVEGIILATIPVGVIIAQIGYYVDPHNRILMNESIEANQDTLRSTVAKLFGLKQREIFLLILDKKGNIDLARKESIKLNIVKNKASFNDKKSLIKGKLNELLDCEELSLEFFLATYNIIIKNHLLELALTSVRFNT